MHGRTVATCEGGKLRPDAWSTLDVRPRDRYANWNEALDASHSAWHLDDRTPEDFRGAFEATALDDLRLVQCACDPCSGSRSGHEIAADSDAFFGLLLIQRGCEEVTVELRGAFVSKPHGPFLGFDGADPVQVALAHPQAHRLHRAIAAVARAPNALERLGEPLDWRHGVGAVAGAHIRTLSDEAMHIDFERGPAAAEMLLHLISADLDQPGDAPLNSTQARLLARVDAYVTAHLDDVDLGPQSIASALGISVRSLHLLYSHRGTTVSRRILERRLERCRGDLVMQPRLSITEVAFRWGFSDMAHFSRAFRRQYNETASAYRSRHVDSGITKDFKAL